MISLIIILAYILYKRLLKTLQKDRLTAIYFSVEEFTVNRTHPAVQAEITLKLTSPDKIIIDLISKKVEKKTELFNQELPAGVHYLEVNLGELANNDRDQKIGIYSSNQSWVKNL